MQRPSLSRDAFYTFYTLYNKAFFFQLGHIITRAQKLNFPVRVSQCSKGLEGEAFWISDFQIRAPIINTEGHTERTAVYASV